MIMKIMIISNYLTKEYRKLCYDGLKPKNHLWGGDLLSRNNEVNHITKADFSILSLISIWFQSFYYDCIFVPVASYTKYLGILKKLHLLKPKLVVVLHHPPFQKLLRYCSFDYMFFLSLPHYRTLQIKDSSYFPWGCDVDFYHSNGLIKEDMSIPCVFISNGYTNRDNDTLVKAAELSDKKLFYTAKVEIPTTNPNIHHCKQYFKTDLEILKIMKNYDVLIIPTFKSNEMIGTIGLTSFLDAVGMNMPVIVADNSPMSVLVKEYNIGLVYKAGDARDLADKMSTISKQSIYKIFKENMRKYSEDISVDKVSVSIQKIIENIAK